MRGLSSVPEISGITLYRLYRAAWVGLDWLYPPECGGCGRQEERWCGDCQKNTDALSHQVCSICGRENDSGICSQCRTSIPAYSGLRSWAEYSGSLRNAVHRLKYYGDISLGEILARPMIDLLQTLDWRVELIVPVPMAVMRRKERGYNQAAMLALPIALYFKIPYQPQALIKVCDTRSQVGLNPTQRYANVRDAFVGRENYTQGKSILVVDDVVTTGATMEACARTLLRAHARSVFGLTLARSGRIG